MATDTFPPSTSSRSSFLISPSPSPGPPPRSPSPSFITTTPSNQSSPTPTKRKRHPESPLLVSSPTRTNSNSSISRSDSTSTSLSSGPFSSQSSDASSIPFLRRDANGSARTPSRSPPKKSVTQLKTKLWDEKIWEDQHEDQDAPCIGAGGMPDRAMEMRVGGVRTKADSDPASTGAGDAYRQWRERSRAASIETPDSPRSVVSKRMFELGLVDRLERSASTRTNDTMRSLTSEDVSYVTKDEYYDVLGEEYPAPGDTAIKDDPAVSRMASIQYKLKAVYSPCPTLVRVPTVEMVEDPKLWPATISTPVLTQAHSDAKRQRHSPSPPLAPRPISPSKANVTPQAERSIAVPSSQDRIGSNYDSLTDQPQTRPSSPPLPTPANPNPLTWHATEITGHRIDHKRGDDGTGIDGVGFKPTKQQEEERRQKRKRQIEEWRKRQDKEARSARSKARADMKEGFGLIGITHNETSAIDSGDKRTVRFAT